MAVIVENKTVGRLLGGMLAPLTGAALQQKRSFLEGKLGETVGSAKLSVLDDPHVVRGLASRLWDGEGMATSPGRSSTRAFSALLHRSITAQVGCPPPPDPPRRALSTSARRSSHEEGTHSCDRVPGCNSTASPATSEGLVGYRLRRQARRADRRVEHGRQLPRAVEAARRCRQRPWPTGQPLPRCSFEGVSFPALSCQSFLSFA